MGTNYYVKKKLNECRHCGRFDEERTHIGKNFWGWSFLLNPLFSTFQKWREFLRQNDGHIYDEYDELVSAGTLISIIESKKDAKDGWVDDFERNQHETVDEEGYRISKHREFS